jgi:hypothetical protein
MGCKEVEMERLRDDLWDFVEKALITHMPVESWLLRAATSHAEGGCGHPKGWIGREEYQARWPVLHALGWLLPTTHEMDFQPRHAMRPVTLEGAYDLGYRGVIPPKIAERITRPPEPGCEPENKDRRDEYSVSDVKATIVAVGVRLARMYAKALD